jgi:hypothetical protein
VQIDLQYESSIPVAEGIADFYLNILGNQRPMPNQLIILANHSNTLMVNALDLDVGDKVGLDESASGITTDDPDSDNPVGYFINEKQLTYAPGGIIAATFTLAPSAPAGVFIWDESVWDESTTWAF